MKIYKYPARDTWKTLLQRPALQADTLQQTVRQVFEDVRTQGDEALRRYEAAFDKVQLTSLRVTEADFEEAERLTDDTLKQAIATATDNIRRFHAAQIASEQPVETMPGVKCWRRSLPIEKVGLYVPGGSAPLFSTVLMLGIPALIAGCREIVLCTPPGKNGKVAPAVLYAARYIGLTSVFTLGGIQAVAAMTCGTESVPAVYKILGPGNQYVQAAKQYAAMYGGVSIDMPAGPSEVMVLADSTCRPAFVAADLLSQAEHGPDSQVVLVTDSEQVAAAVNHELDLQTGRLPRREIASKALENSRIIILSSLQEMMEMSNFYAPEHLILSVADPQKAASMVTAAGSVFLGNYAPESAGDYASGTNHSLPTSGYARSCSGVSTDSFIKKITFQHITREGFAALGPVIETMAGAEQLAAHRNAATIRLQTP
ncbi:MAG: histidinol dehydrogenase [Bacteroidales bacterium]|nr:histidinol dehydrogenase [Bacteroidales bacterium]